MIGSTSVMEIPPWPLPVGHKFGLSRYGSVMIHDGSNDSRHQTSLRQWQAAYKGRMRRPRFEINGRFDANTQRAVAEVQRMVGQPTTGLLGPDEWALVWTLSPPKGQWVRPGGEHAERQRQQQQANVKDYWRRYSKWDVVPGRDPAAPSWFPGRPFGERTKGFYVNPVLRFFGMREHGSFNAILAQRVRGFQKVHGLPVSGLVDARTACLIEELSQPPATAGG